MKQFYWTPGIQSTVCLAVCVPVCLVVCVCVCSKQYVYLSANHLINQTNQMMRSIKEAIN